MNAKEFIQAAIDEVENPRRRKRLQRRFDANADDVADDLSDSLAQVGSSDAKELRQGIEDGSVSTIDPEKLKRWLELAKILLPIILALF